MHSSLKFDPILKEGIRKPLVLAEFGLIRGYGPLLRDEFTRLMLEQMSPRQVGAAGALVWSIGDLYHSGDPFELYLGAGAGIDMANRKVLELGEVYGEQIMNNRSLRQELKITRKDKIEQAVKNIDNDIMYEYEAMAHCQLRLSRGSKLQQIRSHLDRSINRHNSHNTSILSSEQLSDMVYVVPIPEDRIHKSVARDNQIRAWNLTTDTLLQFALATESDH